MNDRYGNALQLIATWVGLGDRDESELYYDIDLSDEDEAKALIKSDLIDPFFNSSDEIKRRKLDGLDYLLAMSETDLRGVFEGALVTLEIRNYLQFMRWVSDVFNDHSHDPADGACDARINR
jgi:hypothetical protein